MELVRSVWHGDKPITQTFWLWYVVVGGIVTVAATFLLLNTGADGAGALALRFLISAFAAAVGIWVAAGAWRAATNSTEVFGAIGYKTVVMMVSVIAIPIFVLIAVRSLWYIVF